MKDITEKILNYEKWEEMVDKLPESKKLNTTTKSFILRYVNALQRIHSKVENGYGELEYQILRVLDIRVKIYVDFFVEFDFLRNYLIDSDNAKVLFGSVPNNNEYYLLNENKSGIEIISQEKCLYIIEDMLKTVWEHFTQPKTPATTKNI